MQLRILACRRRRRRFLILSLIATLFVDSSSFVAFLISNSFNVLGTAHKVSASHR